MCFYPLVRVYHWLFTVNCKAVMISGCLLPWHDYHLGVQWNTIAAWATIHSGFPVTPNQWKRERLNSEKCLEQPWLLEPPNSGNVSHKPWSVMLSCIWGAAIINYVACPNPFWKFWIYCPMFVHVDVWFLTTNGVSNLCYENDWDLMTWGVLSVEDLMTIFFPNRP